MAPLIQVKGVSKVFGEGESRTVALNDATFSIDKGEFVAVMGPSGSGKSTLLHILGFLDNATSGSYSFDGHNIAEFSQKQIADIRNRRIGFVFQAFNLLPRTTVLANVELPMHYSDVSESLWRKKALAAIEAVDLGHRINHEPSELSGGEKQRVAIARALVNDPEVIFADEPTGNLDSKSGRAVMEIIRRLNDQGKTVILITHETYTAENAKRIIRLLDGKIESDQPVSDRISIENYMK